MVTKRSPLLRYPPGIFSWVRTIRHGVFFSCFLLLNLPVLPQGVSAQDEQASNRIEIKSRAYEHLKQATVKVTAGGGLVIGSGIIVGYRSNGQVLILTAAHVVAVVYDIEAWLDFYDDIEIQLPSKGITLPARIIDRRYVDQVHDLALLISDGPVENPKIISYVPEKKVQDNLNVIAFGYPEASQVDNVTVSSGFIERIEQDRLYATTRVTGGNSGGALIRKDGGLVGVIKEFDVAENRAVALNIGFVRQIVDSWLRDIPHAKAWSQVRSQWWLYTAIGIAIGGGTTYLICRANDGCPKPDEEFGRAPSPEDIVLHIR